MMCPPSRGASCALRAVCYTAQFLGSRYALMKQLSGLGAEI